MKPNKEEFNSISDYYQAMAYYCAEMAEETARGIKADEYLLLAEEFQELADELNDQ